MQFSAGVVLLYNLFLIMPVARKDEKIPFRYHMILLIALITALAGVLFSLMHLGNPLNAIKTLSNLKQSWLSREILFVLLYSGLLIFVAGIQLKFPMAVRTHKWLLNLTSLTGLVLVYVMSRIYQLPSMPAWNSIFTPISFYLAMFLSGSSLILLFQLKNGSWACQKGLTLLIIVIPIIQIGLLPFHMTWLGEAGEAGKQSLSLLLNDYFPAFFMRLGFNILTTGFGFWAFFSVQSETTKNRNLFIPALFAFISAVASILIDRFLFYSQVHPGSGF